MSERDPLHSVHTVVDEGNAFDARHPELSGAAASTGGLVWGLLRALYECPDCPGRYRVPTLADKDACAATVCPACGGVWTWRDAPPEEPAKKGRKRR